MPAKTTLTQDIKRKNPKLMTPPATTKKLCYRFRGYLPVVVDVETGGFNAKTDALLEMAAIVLSMDDEGILRPEETLHCHIEPFPNANLNPDSLAFNKIDPHHPFRNAISESLALQSIFRPIRQAIKKYHCSRAILVGHNPMFDLGFLNAAVERTSIKRNPFHPFGTFDTATLGGLAFGQTVLARAISAAEIDWDGSQAHSAKYDAEKTAELFCLIVNRWRELELIAAEKPA